METDWRYIKIDKPTIYCCLKLMIKELFPSFIVDYNEKAMRVIGIVSDPDWSEKYKFGINYEVGKHPSAYILHPIINGTAGIHMYSNYMLCLYHPLVIFNLKFTLINDIIPWSIKWMHYYEIWKINGHIWIGQEEPHGL